MFITVVTFGIGVAAKNPNIVFILADDLGIGDANCNGGDHCLIEKPHIDQLAEEGLRFTDAHVDVSICGTTPAKTGG